MGKLSPTEDNESFAIDFHGARISSDVFSARCGCTKNVGSSHKEGSNQEENVEMGG